VTPDRCPGCGTKLEPDMLACPNCPMSFPEGDGDSGATANPLKESKYYQFVFPILFFGAIAMIVWYLGSGLMHLGQESAQSNDSGNLSGIPRIPAPPSHPAESAKPPEEAPTVSIVAVDENGAPAAKGAAGRRPPAAAVAEWRLRGTVYDLTTLKPLGGVSLVFADEETNATIKTRSDSQGRYRVIVPPLDGRGYAVAIDKNGYATNYLDPSNEDGVREKDAEERKAMARDLSSTLGAAHATVQSESAEPLVTDFYLAPRL